MSENSKIEWCHHTFNPWTGCTKVGPGCDHCYAEGWAKRSGIVQWGPGAERRRTSAANWRQPLKWNAEAERLNIRYRVFCASLGDVADNEVPMEWRRDLFEQIRITPYLDWLLVTKRIGNFMQLAEQVIQHIESMPDWSEDGPQHPFEALRNWLADWIVLGKPPANVWLGITVVNQDEADRDIPKLLKIPAAVRFLSMEPLLGPVSLRWMSAWPENKPLTAQNPSGITDHLDGLRRLDWVIVGGESGPKARPMHPQWARDLRDQCAEAGVPFLFKQWGEWSPRALICGAGHDFQTIDPQCKRWPDVIRLGEHGRDTRIIENCTPDSGQDVYVQRVGKKNAGRQLDGVQHDGYPMQPPRGGD